MTSISEWKRWILYNLIGEGIHNVLFEDQIKKLSGRHYENNLTIALNILVDSGILLKLETNKRKKFIVNYERLSDAQKILNDNRNWTYNKDNEKENKNVNQYFSEPEGYSFWFNIEEKNPRNRKSIYNLYCKKTDDLDFSAQIITQRYSRILHMGSLRQNDSNISKLWKACQQLSQITKKGEFILQDLQDKERKACGNNRQRGKISLAIFKKLGYIRENGRKGNSTSFTLTGKNPPFTTLDKLINT
ncbi:MAG: hypothetical protein H0X50_10875 [Nitrosopumilus sp.]|nr:hypothetical protein [Nitrosopumilus sp.]